MNGSPTGRPFLSSKPPRVMSASAPAQSAIPELVRGILNFGSVGILGLGQAQEVREQHVAEDVPPRRIEAEPLVAVETEAGLPADRAGIERVLAGHQPPAGCHVDRALDEQLAVDARLRLEQVLSALRQSVDRGMMKA